MFPTSIAVHLARRPRAHSEDWYRRSGVLALVLVFALVTPAAPASADGEGETTIGYLLVQQALGHLAHGAGHVAMDEALEKVGDALETEDNAGVDLALVTQAQSALEAEDVVRARVLLQQSIQDAVKDLPAATGQESGTTVVALPLRGRGSLSGQDWTFAAVSLALLLVGAGLAYRFRPHDTVRQLRVSLAGGPDTQESDGGQR